MRLPRSPIDSVISRAVAAYVKGLQSRVGKMEKSLGDYKLYVAEHYASKEFLSDLKRSRISDVIPTLVGAERLCDGAVVGSHQFPR
jgi:hypothetical protein